ncbi:hypothetical protein NMY22_g4906 [Coprinellus aureogranulatus]|nr:hypothetical protein NMY22_g4906 [Coprinellus aureogranulatus]
MHQWHSPHPDHVVPVPFVPLFHWFFYPGPGKSPSGAPVPNFQQKLVATSSLKLIPRRGPVSLQIKPIQAGLSVGRTPPLRCVAGTPGTKNLTDTRHRRTMKATFKKVLRRQPQKAMERENDDQANPTSKKKWDWRAMSSPRKRTFSFRRDRQSAANSKLKALPTSVSALASSPGRGSLQPKNGEGSDTCIPAVPSQGSDAPTTPCPLAPTPFNRAHSMSHSEWMDSSVHRLRPPSSIPNAQCTQIPRPEAPALELFQAAHIVNVQTMTITIAGGASRVKEGASGKLGRSRGDMGAGYVSH